MTDLADAIDACAAETQFSGVVQVDRGSDTEVARAYGDADRAHGVPNRLDTQFAMGSGSKAFTALAVMSLVESGALALTTTARALLGDDLPLIDDRVTVEDLLGHRSGIGDYLEEEGAGDITDYVTPVPVHTLVTTEDFLTVLDGDPTNFPPGEQFSYCNGGFVVLALLAERASGVAYHDLVTERVLAPAGLVDTAFFRTDELPGRAARAYLAADGLRTNVLHLPVCATGDGNAFTTAADVRTFWAALFAGRIVPPARVAEMVAPRSDAPEDSARYGLGFWLDEDGDGVRLEGYDAGISFRTRHDPTTGLTWTVLANWSDGAWPVAKLVEELTT
jgi:CubicO group peptidase (beta-lactamase class C family)